MLLVKITLSLGQVIPLLSINAMSLNETRMTQFITVKVECYSGYKADEYPQYFIRNKIRFEISHIVDRWYQGDSSPEFPATDYFKVETTSGELYIIKHDLKSDSWYLSQ